jgi:hypothetical protein
MRALRVEVRIYLDDRVLQFEMADAEITEFEQTNELAQLRGDHEPEMCATGNGSISIAANGRWVTSPAALPRELQPVEICGCVSKNARGVPDGKVCEKPSGHGDDHHQGPGGAMWSTRCR